MVLPVYTTYSAMQTFWNHTVNTSNVPPQATVVMWIGTASRICDAYCHKSSITTDISGGLTDEIVQTACQLVVNKLFRNWQAQVVTLEQEAPSLLPGEVRLLLDLYLDRNLEESL